eukprot:86533_1
MITEYFSGTQSTNQAPTKKRKAENRKDQKPTVQPPTKKRKIQTSTTSNLFEKYDNVQEIHLQVPIHFCHDSDLGLSNIQQRTQRTENGSWEWTVTLSDKQYGYTLSDKPEYFIYEITFKRL